MVTSWSFQAIGWYTSCTKVHVLVGYGYYFFCGSFYKVDFVSSFVATIFFNESVEYEFSQVKKLIFDSKEGDIKNI